MQRFGTLFERVPLGFRSKDGRVVVVKQASGRYVVVQGERETYELPYREAKRVAVTWVRDLNERGGVNQGDYPR